MSDKRESDIDREVKPAAASSCSGHGRQLLLLLAESYHPLVFFYNRF